MKLDVRRNRLIERYINCLSSLSMTADDLSKENLKWGRNLGPVRYRIRGFGILIAVNATVIMP